MKFILLTLLLLFVAVFAKVSKTFEEEGLKTSLSSIDETGVAEEVSNGSATINVALTGDGFKRLTLKNVSSTPNLVTAGFTKPRLRYTEAFRRSDDKVGLRFNTCV